MSRWACVLLVLPVVWALPASARLCGDDVRGEDVPCACGDVVVSDLRLGDDPVFAAPCASDGLIVDARGVERAVTIDLRGRTLRGLGRGTGILVLHGGPGGARIVSTEGVARIDGFEDGLAGRGSDAIGLVENLHVRRSGRDGIRLHGDGFEIRATRVLGAGRDGFSLNGRNYRLEQTLAIDSGRYGYFIMGTEGQLGSPGKGVAALNSTKTGFTAMGADHRFVDCEASGNLEDGLHLLGMRHQIAGCRADENRRDGIAGTGSGWWVVANRASGNGNDGIAIRGPNMVDGGRNQGSDNRGERNRRPVQCEVGGAACAE
jgi:hypothetical protein